MRLLIEDDEGTCHEVQDNVDFLDWYSTGEVAELMQGIRDTITSLSLAHDDADAEPVEDNEEDLEEADE